jgi:hypothetical protein
MRIIKGTKYVGGLLNSSSDNPITNALPPGVSYEQVEEAVRRSGYPLQTLVASELKNDFVVSEEWSYLDRETGTKRALDVFAYKRLQEPRTALRIVPNLALLIECKRSDLPYMFFKRIAQGRMPEFPCVCGLRAANIEVQAPGVMRSVSISDCLGLFEHEFVKSEPIYCATFSKANRKGGGSLELSGSDPFNHVVMPLVNAMDHAYTFYKAVSDYAVYHPVLALGICVLDAPMIVVEGPPDASSLTLSPWIRIVRQEASIEAHKRATRFYAIDVIHRDYLRQFVDNKLLPFAEFFAERAMKQHLVLATKRGYVKDLNSWAWNDVMPAPNTKPEIKGQ